MSPFCFVHSEPGSDSSGLFWSCGISPLFSVHQIKAVPFLYLSPLGSSRWLSSPHSLFAYNLVEYPGRLMCVSGDGKKSLENPHQKNIIQLANCDDIQFNPVGVHSHTLHYHLYKAQVTEDSRRAIGQRWTTTPTKGTKCVKDGHCYCVRVCSMLAAHLYLLVSRLLCTGHIHVVLWLPILQSILLPFL